MFSSMSGTEDVAVRGFGAQLRIFLDLKFRVDQPELSARAIRHAPGLTSKTFQILDPVAYAGYQAQQPNSRPCGPSFGSKPHWLFLALPELAALLSASATMDFDPKAGAALVFGSLDGTAYNALAWGFSGSRS